jgi:hypothetical protein
VPRLHHVVRLLPRLQPVAPRGPRAHRVTGRSASAAAVRDGHWCHRAHGTPQPGTGQTRCRRALPMPRLPRHCRSCTPTARFRCLSCSARSSASRTG